MTYLTASQPCIFDVFHVHLEARHPERDCRRAYLIQAGTDLLGDWLVEVTFGRIGTHGSMVRYAVESESATRRMVQSILRQRAMAERRIGVHYRLKAGNDPSGWMPEGLATSWKVSSVILFS